MNTYRGVMGVGIYDMRGKSSTVHYSKWTSMINRCYARYTWEDAPSYKGCSVADEWHKFSNFYSWLDAQDYKGKALDKDLLGCTWVYSPDNCCLISSRLNNLIGPRGLVIPMTPKRRRDFEECLEVETDPRVLKAVSERFLS